MIEYLTVSIICILITLFQKKKESALACSFVILTVFFAIRYNFGNDYSAYLMHFDLANEGSYADAFDSERFENGWVILCRLCKPIGFFGMVIFLTIFENAVLYYFFRKYIPQNLYWLALFGYLFSPSLCLTGLSMMRQFLAICVCLIAFDMAMARKIVLSILLVLLAVQFHTTAYVCLPICFIALKKDVRMSKRAAISFLTVLFFIFFTATYFFANLFVYVINESVFDIYEGRIGQDYKSIIGVSTFFQYYILGIILLTQGKQKKTNRFFVLIFSLFMIIDAFKPIAPLISRVGLYFYILYPICMPNAIGKLSNTLIKKVTILLLLLFGVYGCLSFILSPGWGNSFLVYETIFSVNRWM